MFEQAVVSLVGDGRRPVNATEPPGSGVDHDVVVTGALRPALELAVSVVAAGSRRRPPEPVPDALRPYLRVRRLPDRALAVVRAALDHDPDLRRRVAAAASPDLVDGVGQAWLARPAGEHRSPGDDVAPPAAIQCGAAGEWAGEMRRERRKRAAAERAAERAIAVLREVEARLEAEQARSLALVDEVRTVHGHLAARHRDVAGLTAAVARAERRRIAAEELVEQATLAATTATARADEASAVRDAMLADRAEEASLEWRASVEQLPAPRRPVREVRTPLAIPGGVYGNSLAAAEFLLRSGAVVLVDGYNVAMLGWPSLTLEQQREQCVAAAEGIARRWATKITIVFDGAAVIGATARRRLVRVVFSPDGVSADDVIRRQVSAMETRRPVVVVTNDRAVIDDVRADGANVLASEQFLAVPR